MDFHTQLRITKQVERALPELPDTDQEGSVAPPHRPVMNALKTEAKHKIEAFKLRGNHLFDTSSSKGWLLYQLARLASALTQGYCFANREKETLSVIQTSLRTTLASKHSVQQTQKLQWISGIAAEILSKKRK